MVTIRVGTQQVHVPAGSPLLNVSTEHNLPIVFGCRAGRCGTCLVQVVSGSANLRAPTVREEGILKVVDAEPDWRLACQCIAFGDVHLRYV
ncbi:(2Fe-2S)-binding protein [Streptomyces sp. NBC_01077]|uniref:2Fe-2S iron-sulfur cluster-binding protein n=1 Tax=Streptomyces sp. NBC_01077 TaxID=2903746 RepID=UPI003867C41A|nr:(2Fe-2S)-binding protein [Streptomyces sp. NBC_01077]WSV43583.1 (2Fe-2S)-binding protein [Streptomyces sp. NBC_01077]